MKKIEKIQPKFDKKTKKKGLKKSQKVDFYQNSEVIPQTTDIQIDILINKTSTDTC